MEEKKDKRQRILEAARTVFSQKGYYQAKVEEIALLADVGKGTVYEYFASKLELFQETYLQLFNKYTERFNQERQKHQSLSVFITKVIQIHLEFAQDNRDFNLLTFANMGVNDELFHWVSRMRKEGLERLENLVREGIRRQEFKPIDPELGARLLSSVLDALIMPVILEGRNYPPQETAQAVSEMLFRGLLIS